MIVCIPYTNNYDEQTQWDYLLSNFKPNEVYILNPKNEELPKTNVYGKGISIKSIGELPNYEIVFLAPQHGRYIQGNKNIIDFKHPDNVIYMVGSNSVYPNTDDFIERKADHLVYIPTDTNDDMYNWVAMAITLYDRKFKLING